MSDGGAAAGSGWEWPALPYAAWKDTKDTLHMCLQVVGKVRLALTPVEPQWGNVPLYLTARGLTTSPLPSRPGTFDIEVDLVDHQVAVRGSDGAVRVVPLAARPVAAFYRDLVTALDEVGAKVEISTVPSEVADPVPFPDDTVHAAYDPERANRFWRVLAQVDLVFKEHRARFLGRASPVHFFWGSFDLAITRYSGRPAEPPPGADRIMRLSANAEQVCAGFWPGNEQVPEPAFFAYAYPKPDGIERAPVGPAAAFWSDALGEFLLRYEDVRSAASPQATILEFLETTYEAAARLAGWDPGLVATPGGPG
jgi:hypothetical protein